MKIIFRLISAALFFIAAASCNLSEINNSDDPNNNGSGKKEYSITAKIIQTRVKYTDGAVLKQEWEIDDRLIGCYSSSGDIETIEFTVQSINDDGSANLSTSDNLPSDGTTIALLYDPYGDSELSSGSLSVDLRSQNFDIDNQGTSVLPAFMSASAVYSETGGATFNFHNDCAIIEVDGIYKAQKESGITDISSVSITNLFANGSYTFQNGEFTLSGGTTESTITVSCPRTTTLDMRTGALNKPVFLAVIPTKEDDKRTIGVTFSYGGQTICTAPSYGTTAFAPGKCYVIYPKDMVAKTVDNQYFTSVAAAFENAKDLDGKLGTGVENTVTLVKEEIYGLLEDAPHDAEEDLLTRIRINYPVTLDLNGCILDLDYWDENDAYNRGGFIVLSNNGHLIVKDNVGKGCIRSISYCPIIENHGTVDILGGKFKYWETYMPTSGYSPLIKNDNTLNVSGGSLYCYFGSAIESSGANAKVKITGGVIGNESDTYEALQVLGGTECTISGGVIYSKGIYASAIGCRSSSGNYPTLTIKWPESSSGHTDYEPLIYSAGEWSTTVPISAYMSGVNNAQIIIKGGCLISNNTYNAFYCDDEGSNLILGKTDTDFNFGGFYSNVPWVITNGQTIDAGNTLLNLYVEGGIVLPNDAQHYGAILQTDGTLISAIEEILENATEKDLIINDLFLINAVTSN